MHPVKKFLSFFAWRAVYDELGGWVILENRVTGKRRAVKSFTGHSPIPPGWLRPGDEVLDELGLKTYRDPALRAADSEFAGLERVPSGSDAALTPPAPSAEEQPVKKHKPAKRKARARKGSARSSRTGRFVKAVTARRHPESTEIEGRKPAKKRARGKK